MLTSEQYPTICKSRIIAKGQQLCRLDQEDTGINIEDKILDLLNELKSSSLKFDCIVLSDYKKGMLTNVLTTEIIQMANKNNIPVIIDPKGYDAQKYQGATYITPNMNEFRGLTGLNEDNTEKTILLEGKKILEEK